jgi:hypothetical protein
MSKTLKIELAVPHALSVNGLVSSFQDFGEDVYRALRDECDVPLTILTISLARFIYADGTVGSALRFRSLPGWLGSWTLTAYTHLKLWD